MYKGLSSFETEKIFKKLNNDDIDKNFIVAFLLDKMNKFINFHLAMKAKDAKYQFLISNTDRSDREGTLWWVILYIHPIKFFSLICSELLDSKIRLQDDKK